MSEPTGAKEPDKPEDEKRQYTSAELQMGWVQRRRDKAVQEILANRRGEYTVPTWVLTALLVAIIAAVAALIVVG